MLSKRDDPLRKKPTMKTGSFEGEPTLTLSSETEVSIKKEEINIGVYMHNNAQCTGILPEAHNSADYDHH
jgi:hypothetical protein